MVESIDFSQPTFWVAVGAIAFNPTFWNCAARSEYHYKTITKLFGGKSLYGCYALAITIFLLGLTRDAIYERALRSQPTHPLLEGALPQLLAILLFGAGNLFVLSSMWALGITGTYLGDYFGILMDEPVTSFPFNVIDAPMYYGSTLSFAGTAIWWGKPAGLLLTCEVLAVYIVALQFEDPFTAEIYAKRDRKRKQEKLGGGKTDQGVKKEL
ncbi:MAG: hypothetical protein Q9165_005105 [Trypethelium subeluteriae]